MSESVNLIN